MQLLQLPKTDHQHEWAALIQKNPTDFSTLTDHAYGCDDYETLDISLGERRLRWPEPRSPLYFFGTTEVAGKGPIRFLPKARSSIHTVKPSPLAG